MCGIVGAVAQRDVAEILLEGLLERLGFKPQLVVVELNGAIINPKDIDNNAAIKDN